MLGILLTAINTRHTHVNLANAYIQAYWQTFGSGELIERADYELNQPLDSIVSDIICRKPSIVTFSAYIWNIQAVLAVAGSVKAALPETFVILGGPEVSFNPASIIAASPWIGAIVCGEGEETFTRLARKIFSNAEITSFPGVVAGDFSKNPQGFEPATLIEPLDTIPSPFQAGLFKGEPGFVYYESSRGCPFRCGYCLSSVPGKLRNFTMERVKADLEWFFTSPYQQIRFADRTFNFDSKRACAILSFILETSPTGKVFHFEIQADILSEEVISLFARGSQGMFHLEIGIQSTDNSVLKASNRHVCSEKQTSNITTLKKRTNCHIHLDLLAGLPSDTMETFRKSLDETCLLEPDTIQLGIVKILHGTVFEKLKDSGELSAGPLPPYAVVRTRLIDPEKMIILQDLGRVVEAFYNTNRFRKSLKAISRLFFEGSEAAVYEALSVFWRQTSRPFLHFTPKAMSEGLLAFVETLSGDSSSRIASRCLIEHENHLTQKVPVGDLGSSLFSGIQPKGGAVKLTPGHRIFWFEVDPFAVAKHCFTFTVPTPVIYRFKKDLSLKPETIAIELEPPERFLLAAISEGIPPEEAVAFLASLKDSPAPGIDLESSMRLLFEMDLVYTERTRR